MFELCLIVVRTPQIFGFRNDRKLIFGTDFFNYIGCPTDAGGHFRDLNDATLKYLLYFHSSPNFIAPFWFGAMPIVERL